MSATLWIIFKHPVVLIIPSKSGGGDNSNILFYCRVFIKGIKGVIFDKLIFRGVKFFNDVVGKAVKNSMCSSKYSGGVNMVSSTCLHIILKI